MENILVPASLCLKSRTRLVLLCMTRSLVSTREILKSGKQIYDSLETWGCQINICYPHSLWGNAPGTSFNRGVL